MTEPVGDGVGEPGSIDVAELEREQLLTYIEWAEVEGPWWYLPVYGAAIGLWVASYELGRGWGTVAALLFAATMGLLVRVITSRTGVSTPRFGGMPGALLVTFLPIVVAVIGGVGAVASASARTDDPPFVWLGLGIGVAAAGAGWLNAVWYRAVARRLAAEHGLVR